MPSVEECVKEFDELGAEFSVLESTHKEYLRKLDQMSTLQSKCVKELTHQRYRLGIIKKSIKSKKARMESPTAGATIDDLSQKIHERRGELKDMEEFLPKKGAFYLQIVLGSVNVSMLQKDEKFKYKDEYEKFKLIVNGLALSFSVFILFANSRALDLLFKFLLVWYYCTLTIRESILRVNGSRIKGWWRFHHFLFTVLSGLLLIWPDDRFYYEFRPQFLWFCIYISLVQLVQFRYQRACLYRLRALGERKELDVTLEGFHSWMWKGLSYVLPFLFIAYAFELYNAWVLYKMSLDPESTWHVPVMSAMFLAIFLGNLITTGLTIPQKLREKSKLKGRSRVVHKYLSKSSEAHEDHNKKQS